MDLNYMKRRNSLFDAPKNIGAYPPFDFNQQDEESGDKLSVPPTQPVSKFSSMYADIANQQGGPANQKFKDFLDSAEPNKDEYKPGKLTRLSAILAGVSDGYHRGGGAGFKSANNILDSDYDEAMGRYNNQGKKLEAAAGLEEKDMGRRVGILKDIITQDHQERVDAENAKYHEGIIKNGADRNKTAGTHYDTTIDPKTGLKKIKIIRPDASVIGDIDAGQGALSQDEKLDFSKKDAAGKFDATKGGRIEVAKAGAAARGEETRKTQDRKFENLQEFLQYKQDNGIGSKYVGHRNKDGKLVMINNQDPTDIVVTGTDFDTMSDADKQKAKIELKRAPNAPKDDTTKTTNLTRDKDGKVIKSETTTTSGKSKVHIKLSDGRELDIPADKLEEAKKRDPKLVVK